MRHQWHAVAARRLALLASAAALFLAGESRGATTIAGPITNPANGYNYYLLSEDTWTNSELAARSLGNHLVTIRNQAENDWIYATFTPLIAAAPGSTLWTGMFSDYLGSGNFGAYVWSSGEPVTFANFNTGSPDHARGNEQFVHMWTPNATSELVQGQWNDLENNPTGFGIHPFAVMEAGAPFFVAPSMPHVPSIPEADRWVLMAIGIAIVALRVRRRAWASPSARSVL